MQSPCTDTKQPLQVNGRLYAWPKRPTVIICFDGCDPSYLSSAGAAGKIPNIDGMRRDGSAATAQAVVPTFTNPNNISIVCGVPPSIHGVSGNFYVDRATGRDIMMVDATPMRAPTILAAFSDAGAGVVAITAKDKLCKALGRGLKGIAFSAERADSCTEAENGITGLTELVGRGVPDAYSADLSLFVLDAGVRLLETRRPELIYLSLSDYVQHKHGPDEPEALSFLSAVDERLGHLLAGGAVVGIVADHGMTDMSGEDGRPNVLYLGDRLDAAFGSDAMRVVCPITDPFVRHHGALGGFVRVHLAGSEIDQEAVASHIRTLPGVALALTRTEVCRRFELPEDREGDIAVFAEKGVAIGARSKDHDVSQLAGHRLRSHGGLFEQNVPFILSHPLRPDYLPPSDRALKNFDIFDFALNGVVA
jgi:phosphonoacetate hydrolase